MNRPHGHNNRMGKYAFGCAFPFSIRRVQKTIFDKMLEVLDFMRVSSILKQSGFTDSGILQRKTRLQK